MHIWAHMALSSGSIFFLCGTNDIHANDAGGSKSPMRHNIKYSTISRHLVLSFSFALLAHFNAISFVFFYVLTFRFALYTRQHFSLRFATNTHRKSCNPIYCNRMNWKSATFFPTNNLSFNEKNGTISHELKRPNLLIISKLKCSAFQFAFGYSFFCGSTSVVWCISVNIFTAGKLWLLYKIGFLFCGNYPFGGGGSSNNLIRSAKLFKSKHTHVLQYCEKWIESIPLLNDWCLVRILVGLGARALK